MEQYEREYCDTATRIAELKDRLSVGGEGSR